MMRRQLGRSLKERGNEKKIEKPSSRISDGLQAPSQNHRVLQKLASDGPWPPGPVVLKPCHLTFPRSCRDTDEFTFSVGRWSSKIQWSICKSAFLNTDTPVRTLPRCASKGRRVRELIRVMQIWCIRQGLQFMIHVSLSATTLSTSDLMNSYASSRAQAQVSPPLKIRGTKLFPSLSIRGTL